MDLNIEYDYCQPTLSFAAQELAKYLLQLNSAWQVHMNHHDHNLFTIHLAVKDTLEPFHLQPIHNKQLDDQYYISIKEEKGYILGINPRSVLLATYKLLYLVGCRFLRPGDEYTYIPQIEFEELFVSYQSTASLRHRGVCIEGANSIENIIEFIDWLPKLGFNSFFVQFKIPYTFLEMWYNHKFNHHLPPEGFDFDKATTMSLLIDQEMSKRSILHHRVGHGWTCEAIGQSALGWIQSDTILSDEQKNSLALINGQKEFYGGIPINTNLCYSNEDAIEKMSNDIVAYAANHPEIDFLHIWLADEHNNICECHKCQQTNPTDQYIHLLNIVDEKLTRSNIATKIVFLLYHELLWAPQMEKYNNPDRFLLMFAPISRTFEKSYNCCHDLTAPPAYKRNQISLPSSLEDNLSFLKEWQQSFAGDGFIYDYHLGRAHYGDLGYVSISKILKDDINFIKSLGLNGYISCQELRSFLPNALPNYVMGLSLFNTSLTFEEIAEDYFKSCYGDKWRECYHYLDTLSSYYSCDFFNGIGPRKNELLANNIKNALELVKSFRTTIQEQSSITTGVQNSFWHHLDYHSQYSILLSKALLALTQGENTLAQELWYHFTEYIQKNESAFQKCLDVYRINEVATKYTGFKLTF